ncbi:TetR/AcrR family transcriptional regulator [Sphingomicrobium aestuariivivum]|uniref:TetR/AcrR family transcriptional regulator n=1 Tax=Sphingomicrobium aestuariivivum TaxID=1582356 RepID=UPI001FD6644F|nr:TetR/AcrR family transcriptional regulator [Sphingomicrobium aestuariivivum]MCJ8190683.1 TetR/AcrR family transcriptional regulator [Sphingomicrobium aestuariivivum]
MGRDQIVGAAARLFAARPYERVSIRDIGEEAGLTNPALYAHFKGKEALGLAVYERAYARLVEAVEAAVLPDMTPREKVAAYVRAAVGLLGDEGAPMRIVERQLALFGPRVREAWGDRAITVRLAGWIAAGRADGSIRADHDPAFLIAAIIGPVTAFIIQEEAGLAPAEGAADALAALVDAAIAPETAR